MTSIEWLKDYMQKMQYFIGNDLLEAFEQAKEMHKQEIIDAFDEGQEYEYQYHINNAPKFDSQTYYQETFVSKGSNEVEVPKHPSVISENGNELLFDEEGNLIKELPKQDVDKLGNEDVPKLGYDVEKFAEEEYPIVDYDNIFDEEIYENHKERQLYRQEGFISSYNKAKETLYTEEDMNNYAEYCTTHVLTAQVGHPYLSVKEWSKLPKKG